MTAVLLLGMLSGCGSSENSEAAQGDTVLATTYPIYYLTSCLLDGEAGQVSGVTVQEMVTEQVSCLHDYTLTTTQMKKLEQADLVVLSGAGLEDFMDSALSSVPEEDLVDSSEGIALIDDDPHIWLDPERFSQQAENIALALIERYPDQAETIRGNADALEQQLLSLKTELKTALSDISCREIVTFHDGFTYLADAFDLKILAAIEEEEGAEASAAELKEIIDLVESCQLPAVFGERNGSTNALEIVSRETGVKTGILDMLMSGDNQLGAYVTGMQENITVIGDALR
jgi:zinc transport system substrate-binding protein